ncbi:MAG: hypothetical protein R3F60_12850 [bacterium]
MQEVLDGRHAGKLRVGEVAHQGGQLGIGPQDGQIELRPAQHHGPRGLPPGELAAEEPGVGPDVGRGRVDERRLGRLEADAGQLPGALQEVAQHEVRRRPHDAAMGRIEVGEPRASTGSSARRAVRFTRRLYRMAERNTSCIFGQLRAAYSIAPMVLSLSCAAICKPMAGSLLVRTR